MLDFGKCLVLYSCHSAIVGLMIEPIRIASICTSLMAHFKETIEASWQKPEEGHRRWNSNGAYGMTTSYCFRASGYGYYSISSDETSIVFIVKIAALKHLKSFFIQVRSSRQLLMRKSCQDD